MEVQDPAVIYPDQVLLDAVRDRINRGEGLNAEKDVEVVLLKVVSDAFEVHICCMQYHHHCIIASSQVVLFLSNWAAKCSMHAIHFCALTYPDFATLS